jgi:hypothetical protein
MMKHLVLIAEVLLVDALSGNAVSADSALVKTATSPRTNLFSVPEVSAVVVVVVGIESIGRRQFHSPNRVNILESIL